LMVARAWRLVALAVGLSTAGPVPAAAQRMVPRPLDAQSLAGPSSTRSDSASTSAANAAAQPGSELDVTLITFGLGEEVFERFGHNAIWLHDRAHGIDVAYDWGRFSFDQPGFVRRFLTGDTRYWMEASEAGAMLEAYQRIGRPITLQRLNLTPAQRLALRDFLRWNALEENKFYRYDYYLDNCSTRLRDALDRVLGGTIRAATDTARTALTYRRESVRLTDGDKLVQTGIDIALGRPADVPLTAWESFFIPMRLRDRLREITVPVGANGARAPLVIEEKYIAPIPGVPVVPELETAPRLVWRLAFVGVALALLLVAVRIMAISRRGAVWGLAIFLSGWSLLCGVLGVILLLAWTATLHHFWAWNENLLQLSPLSLALVVLVPVALLSGRHQRLARMTAVAVLAIASFGLLMSLLPGGQENRAIVALFFPMHLALAWAIALPQIAAAPIRKVAPGAEPAPV
jgi:hypothetical protein